MAVVGCTPSIDVYPPAAPRLVARYSKEGRAVVGHNNKQYHVGPEQRPELRVEMEPCPWGASSDPPAPCGEDFGAPLGTARLSTDSRELWLGDSRSVRFSDVRSVELVAHGEPFALVEDGVVRRPEQRRHFLGVQLGGSAYFQIVYRFRVVGPLLLDAGGFFFGPPPAMNASAGLILEIPVARRWSPYVGAGGGAGITIGEGEDPDCPEGQTDCPVVAGHIAAAFLYGRLGVAFRFGSELRSQVGVDGGIWSGGIQETDGGDGPPEERRFFSLMAGLSYIWTL